MEGLALSVDKARRPNEDRCISVGFACRVFDLSRRDNATSSHDRESDLLATWNEAKKSLEPALLSPRAGEAPTQRRRMN
jgi:hypothetical protein